MIIEIPSHNEFFRNGINLLNLSWEIAVDIVHDMDQSEIEDWGGTEELEEYNLASQTSLSNGLTLIQQALEMFLKGKICETSPYLLISNDHRDWPKNCDKISTPFSNFKTIDAISLIKVHNSVCTPKLDQDFKDFFENIRRERNLIIHQGSINKKIVVSELLLGVLETFKYFFPKESWMGHREKYLESGRFSIAFSSDHVPGNLVREAELLVRALGYASLKKHFPFSKKVRKYICPHCYYNMGDFQDDIFPLAQLKPNKKNSTNVFCFVCENETKVKREKCLNDGCPSNVITDDPEFDEICLICTNEMIMNH